MSGRIGMGGHKGESRGIFYKRFRISREMMLDAVPRAGDCGEVIVLSGASGCGKTTLCRRLIVLGRKKGLSLAGLLTLPRYEDGRKVGLDVVDISSDAVHPLAETAGMTDGPSTGRFRFHSDGVRWGNAVLRQTGACDLLIIDELGPLEFVQGKGWHDAWDVLRAGAYHKALAVVRPALVECFTARLPELEIRIEHVTIENRDNLPEQIAAYL